MKASFYFLFCSLFLFFGLSAQLDNSVDYRPYYLQTMRISNSLSMDNAEKVEAFKEVEEEFNGLLASQNYQMAILYDKMDKKDSARIYLKKAVNAGFEPYDKEYLETYNLQNPKEDSSYFAKRNQGKAQMAFHISKIDQSIRGRNRKFCAMRTIDSINVNKILDENLLAFSNSGWAQINAVFVCNHGWRVFKKNQKEIAKYLKSLVINGELHPDIYIRLIDRWHWDIDGYQIYGTIGNVREGKFLFVAPLLEPDKINEYRAEIGALSLEESLDWEGLIATEPKKFSPEQ